MEIQPIPIVRTLLDWIRRMSKMNCFIFERNFNISKSVSVDSIQLNITEVKIQIYLKEYFVSIGLVRSL